MTRVPRANPAHVRVPFAMADWSESWASMSRLNDSNRNGQPTVPSKEKSLVPVSKKMDSARSSIAPRLAGRSGQRPSLSESTNPWRVSGSEAGFITPKNRHPCPGPGLSAVTEKSAPATATAAVTEPASALGA